MIRDRYMQASSPPPLLGVTAMREARVNVDFSSGSVTFGNVKSRACVDCGDPTDNTCDCCARRLCEFCGNWCASCHDFHQMDRMDIDSVTAARIAHVDDVLMVGDRPIYGFSDSPLTWTERRNQIAGKGLSMNRRTSKKGKGNKGKTRGAEQNYPWGPIPPGEAQRMADAAAAKSKIRKRKSSADAEKLALASRYTCHRCGRPGHRERDCFHLRDAQD